jgi:hypothetical protein
MITTIPLRYSHKISSKPLPTSLLRLTLDYGIHTIMVFFCRVDDGSDVLDIGSRNARRQRGVGDINSSLGNPDSLTLPNVQDVQFRCDLA